MDIWNGRSSRCLWTSLVITTFVLCLAFVYVSFYTEHRYDLVTPNSVPSSSEKLTEEECISVCDTEECVQQSKILLDNVKSTVEPCEDFYQFACGGFLEKSDPDEVSTFMTRYLKVMRNNLRGLLDSIEASPESASGKMKTVYDSCVKYGSSENQAVQTLIQIISNFGIHDWPHLAPDYKFAGSSFANVIANLLHNEQYGFVSFDPRYVRLGDGDSILNLTARISNSPYENKNQDFRKYALERILKYFSLDSETIQEFWRDSEAILTAIENLKIESEKIYDEDEDSISLCENSMDCITDPEGEWKNMCENMASFINSSDSRVKLNKNFAEIYCADLYFMKNVFHVLRNFSDRSIANYLVLNVIFNHLNDLNFYFRLIDQKDPDFHKFLYDLREPISHWEHCVQWIIGHMGYALGHEFIKNDYTTATQLEVQNLTKELIQATKETISRQEWISDILLETITEMIGDIHDSSLLYMKEASNEAFVNRLFKEFRPSTRSFLENAFEYKRFLKAQEMSGFNLGDMMHIAGSLFIPGASGGDGELTINPGILIPPTYMLRLQRIINLASLGTIIVHEIGHNVQSFLERLMKIDLEKVDYYGDNKLCLEKQFSAFRLESIGKNLDGSKYSRENEADNMGVIIIDKLTEKYTASGEVISLPGLSYKTKQLLYISSAQTWCSLYTKQKYEETYEQGSHSPTHFRLLGMMQNSKGFSEAFGCPEGSYMNPSVKCLLLNV